MKKLFVIITAIILTTAAYAQGNSTLYSSGISAEGLNYYLPKTKITLKVTANKTVSTPGEFSRYAERYLRLSN